MSGLDAIASRVSLLSDSIEQCLIRDRRRFRRRLRRVKGRRGDLLIRSLNKLEAQVHASSASVVRRRQCLLHISCAGDLPIHGSADQIVEAIRNAQCLILGGETGSGKTTQLPKMAMAAGCGVYGDIACTQPRRVAARAVAARLSRETGTKPGDLIGHRVRFDRSGSSDTIVHVLTDGMLLAELSTDRQLERYDTIIIDEAHERSINIDLLMGVMQRLMKRRPELKVIITSATIDTEHFANQFAQAEVIEVPGRAYPVEVHYLENPPEQGDEVGLSKAVVDATARIDQATGGEGDVLVFLPGERDIRVCAQRLTGAFPDREVLPLHARLSLAAQERVLRPSSRRRIICSTNVAETSLTVPSVRAVIDSGFVRVSRWSAKRRVHRLPIEGVCQASAVQRAGRAGRVAPGHCVRLYTEEQFAQRSASLDPEIRRSDLAGVLLRMAALELGAPESFPFLDPLRPTSINAARKYLEDLGAMRQDQLTPLGRSMSELPLEPGVARMLLAAKESGCLEQVLVIAAVLGLPDPRLRPPGDESAADIAHRRLLPRGCESDFMALLALWDRCIGRWKQHGAAATRRWCQEHHISWVRLLEWRDVHHQLRRALREPGLLRRASSNIRPNPIHRALLTGLITQIGRRTEDGDYEMPGGRRFHLHPSSVLHGRQPAWVMAGSLVETSRLWARTCAPVQPGWIARAASHLVRREYSGPRWDGARGCVRARERVSLRGLTISQSRRVNLEPIDPMAARRCFIDQVLVDSEEDFGIPELAAARRSRAKVLDAESRLRKRELLLGAVDRQALWEQRLPAEIIGLRSLQNWIRRADSNARASLSLRPEDVSASNVVYAPDGYPDILQCGNVAVSLRYRFAPGEADDGATASVPLALLDQVDDVDADWKIAGWRAARIEAIIAQLPKDVRRLMAPRAETVAAAVKHLGSLDSGWSVELAAWLSRRGGCVLQIEELRAMSLPDHHLIRWEVESGGQIIGADRNLRRLRQSLGLHWRGAMDQAIAGHPLTSSEHLHWDWETLPEAVSLNVSGQDIAAEAVLIDVGEHVDVVVRPAHHANRAIHLRGVQRLACLTMAGPLHSAIEAAMDLPSLHLLASTRLQGADVLAQAEAMTLMQAGFEGQNVRTRAAFEQACDQAWGQLASAALEVGPMLEQLWSAVLDLEALAERRGMNEAIERQICHLLKLPASFVSPSWMGRLPDWLLLARRRMLGEIPEPPAVVDWDRFVDAYVTKESTVPSSLAQLMCLLEEWRCAQCGMVSAVTVDEQLLSQQGRIVQRDL